MLGWAVSTEFRTNRINREGVGAPFDHIRTSLTCEAPTILWPRDTRVGRSPRFTHLRSPSANSFPIGVHCPDPLATPRFT